MYMYILTKIPSFVREKKYWIFSNNQHTCQTALKHYQISLEKGMVSYSWKNNGDENLDHIFQLNFFWC